MQTFDEFLERFDALFQRTISEESKEEDDFASEYAQLVQALREFVGRKQN